MYSHTEGDHDDPRIPDPAEIVEVDGFGRDPETPQYNGMQRWCRLART
jgi:hypothetical protein